MKEREEIIEQFKHFLTVKIDKSVTDAIRESEVEDVNISMVIQQNLDTLVKDYQDILESYI